MKTLIKIAIVATSCFGAYIFIGYHFHKAHEMAFGLDGLGFTYLSLVTAAVGLVTWKSVK